MTRPRNSKAPIPRNRPKINWKGLFYGFFWSIVLGAAVSFSLTTPDLEIKNVTLSAVHLADSVVVDDLSDKVKGLNILLFQKNSLQRALEDVNEIESVRISRKLPHTLVIKVTERQPIASLKVKEGYAYIGADSLPFHISSLPVSHLPVIYAAGCNTIELRKPCLSANFVYAMNALKNVRAQRLKCSKISVDRRANMCLNMSSGLLVKLGQPDDLTTKIIQLRRTLEYKPSLEREALYVDVSCPTEKVYMPKATSQGVL